jgi:CHAD domain-containing protein
MSAAMRCGLLSDGAVARPSRRVRSVVFDTAASDLGKQNILLRGYEMHGASFVELSWSRPVAGGARSSIGLRVPSLDIGRMLGFSEHLRQTVADRPLEARCVAETERRERLLDLAGARIAVSFDDGFVEARGERTLFHEIELRLVDGPERKLWLLAAQIARDVPARLLPINEVERALARLTGREIGPVKAPRATLDAGASLDEAIVGSLGSCLDQFIANWPTLLDSRQPEEAIHQMRVALRRLRAGIGLLRHAVASDALEDATTRARAIAATLGEARNFDVLCEMMTDGPLASADSEPRFYAMLDVAERRRALAHEQVGALLCAPETSAFVLDLRAALAARDWRPSARAPASLDPHAFGSARDFALFSLERLHRKAMKKSRDLAGLTPEKRHQARIAFKKIRYAAEFFETLFDVRARARRYLRGLSAVQDALGAANDLSVASELLRALGDRNDAIAPACAYAVGWCAHAREGDYTDWKAIDKRLKKLEPFWR